VVLISRFVDAKRARRMRAWLQRSHIQARLRERDDGLHELFVHSEDEHRALDLLLTLYWGLEVDHLRPEPTWQRAATAENLACGLAIALVVSMMALLAWWVIPVLAIFPIGMVGLLAVVAFLTVAVTPPRLAMAREPLRRSR
jgi:hypothetical protein